MAMMAKVVGAVVSALFVLAVLIVFISRGCSGNPKKQAVQTGTPVASTPSAPAQPPTVAAAATDQTIGSGATTVSVTSGNAADVKEFLAGMKKIGESNRSSLVHGELNLGSKRKVAAETKKENTEELRKDIAKLKHDIEDKKDSIKQSRRIMRETSEPDVRRFSESCLKATARELEQLQEELQQKMAELN